jgi:hypothetical protein
LVSARDPGRCRPHPKQNSQLAVDDAYRAKYARYGATYLQPMLAAGAVAATLRLTPRD